jgi:hypothetical protein
MSTTPTPNTKQMRFRENWNARPRFETGADGSFVGRNEYLQRLDSHFRSRNGGTILISGVRGVGKTALIDRALVTSRQELRDNYWANTWKYLQNAPRWHLINHRARNVMRAVDALGPKDAAEIYVARPRRWWQRFDPADRLIRRMHQASLSQLLVLKFSASDISGALADPGQLSVGKPRINPEKLLQSIIRKLHTMFDVAGSQPEANILQWSLRDKKKRQQFFATLEAAYKKSISKSYKEVISNSISALIRETRISTWEGKINAEKALVVLLAVAGGIVFSLMDWSRAWKPLEYVRALSIPTALTGYIIWNWGFKRTREKSSDQSRQSLFSYEYDYSLHQMRQDLEFLFSTLSPSPQDLPKAPYRCFLRTVVVFDELDKLERADQQLDDIVTHFKNFFTLSEAVFVFLTDHDFYEHLTRETVKAQLARHYPPQHTFFNTKMYLRKPEFLRFREAFFGFAEPGWIDERAHSLPSDAMLIDDLLKRDDKPTLRYEKLSLETLTQLYIQRGQYGPPYAGEIETQFEALQKQISSPLAQAQVWASQAARGADDRTLNDMRMAFRATNANSWKDPDAVSFLYYRREDFGDKDKKTIEKFFRELPTASLSRYESVDGAPFTLSDLARALCFQTRNHYFDLYNTVYDYVKLFQGGTPVLQLDESSFTHEMKLWSRYQQLLEIAFESARETNTSREYFNALLIESLYRVFDKRRSGENVKISEILFPPRDDLSAAADTLMKKEDSQTLAVTPVVTTEPETLNQAMTRLMTIAAEKLTALQTSTSGAQNGSLIQINPFTDTDADKINRAIIRLLRLALAHNAIRGISSNLEARLKANNTKPATLGDLEFAWNDDCHSIIRSVIREQHEQELVTFWQTHASELEFFDLELTGLWMPVPMTGESATMHSAISDLRSRAESVRLGQGTISGPDAGGLKASVGTWEYREALWSRAIVDRIRAEDDAEVIEEFDKPQTDPLAVQLVTRKSKIEADTPLHIRAVIRPRNTDYGVFLVVGPLPATAVDFTIVKSLLLEKTSLFWYVTGKDAPEANQPRPDGIYVYTSPLTGGQPPVGGAAMLFTVYSAIASKQRFETIAARLKVESKKEQIALLAQHAGTEVLGPIVVGSEMYALLSEPNLKVAIQSLTEKRERFRTGSIELAGIGTDWPPARAATYVAADIVTNGHLPPEFVDIIERAVSKLVNYVNPERASQDFWLRQFLVATEDPNVIAQALLESAIDYRIDTKMTAANVEDTTLRAAIREYFVPWLSNSIQSLAKAKNVKIESLATVTDWAAELERQRRTLRSSPLPPAPTAPTTR